MYRSLVNCAHHVQLNRSLTKVKCISNQLNHYHNDSHYYGYRPKIRRESDFRSMCLCYSLKVKNFTSQNDFSN